MFKYSAVFTGNTIDVLLTDDEDNNPSLFVDAGADWATWLPGTCQVDRLVRRPGGPPRQMLQERVERRRGPGALSKGERDLRHALNCSTQINYF